MPRLTAKGWPGSRVRPEQAAHASDVKRRGGAEVRVGCSGTAATLGSTARSTARGPALPADTRPRWRLTACAGRTREAGQPFAVATGEAAHAINVGW
jgi:hypothetical protein